RLNRPADHQPQHPAGIGGKRVARPGTPVAEILELPRTLYGLHVALLLRPGKRRWPRVSEADARLDPLDLDVILGLNKRRASFSVAFERSHLVEAALPLRRRQHVLHDL